MKPHSPFRVSVKISLVAATLVATAYGATRLKAPPKSQERITRQVAEIVEKYHVSRHEIDDSVSERLLKRLLKDFDPRKQYFTKADVQKLRPYAQLLDDQIKNGDPSFAYQVHQTFAERLLARVAKVQQLIDAEHDFSVEEEFTIDSKSLDWSTPAELDELWRKQIKYELLNLKLSDTSTDKIREEINREVPKEEDSAEKTLESAKERLHKRYTSLAKLTRETDSEEVLEIYLTSLANCFDPHSSYMSPSTFQEFMIAMRLKLEGIGAALRSQDGYTTVAEVVPGGAAALDGNLKAGDQIIGVGQNQEGEFVDIVDMKLSKVVQLIRGKKGTVVRLKVVSAEGGDPQVLALTRREIELTSSQVKGEIIESGSRVTGRAGRIGVINIPSFYRDFDGAKKGRNQFASAAHDVKKVLRSFAETGVDAIVIDLRNNGGGALVEAIDISSLFIDKGPVVQVKSSDGEIELFEDEDEGVGYSGPLVVLTNRLSASASEIFAGVIKDYRRGIIIGDSTTHGKGTVQSLVNISKDDLFRLMNTPPTGGALKVTISQFYRVNGDSTQNHGVTSDIVLPSLIDHVDIGESFLDNALAFDRVDAVQHDKLAWVSPVVVSSIQKQSEKRIAANEEFQEKQKDISRYLSRKNRKTVTLNEEKLRADRDEGKKAKDEETAEDPDEKQSAFADRPIFPQSYYNDEILAITLDYIDSLRQRPMANKVR